MGPTFGYTCDKTLRHAVGLVQIESARELLNPAHTRNTFSG